MSSLVTMINGGAVTTSLVIAEGTKNDHASVIRLVRTYLADLEEFGRVGFEIRPFETNGGAQSREVAQLNEPQSTLLLTYMRNSDVVRQFKKALVKAFLEVGKDFATWMKDRIQQYGFLEGQDYVIHKFTNNPGRPVIEYAVTLDMAKELAMVERTEKGTQLAGTKSNLTPSA